MGVSLRGTLGLLAVLTSLAAYLVVTGRSPGGRSAPARPPALLAASPPDVARFEIEDGGWGLVAVRHGNAWRDVNGRPLAGDAVRDVLETLATLRPVEIVDPAPANPVDYGLGPDAARLRVLDGDGRPQLALEIGARNPARTGLYARRMGAPEVLLVGAVLRWELQKLRDATPRNP